MEKHAQLKRAVFLCTLILALPSTTWPRTIHVDKNAKGRNDGSSWVDAIPNLEIALSNALVGTKPMEVRVAQGIYKPSESRTVGGPPDFGAEERRNASFKLYSGVTLKGGYGGLGAEDPNARDIVAFRTILSGDHEDDDVELRRSKGANQQTNRSDNNRCVVRCLDASETAVLDGFTITGGYHDFGGRDTPTGGGGLNNYRASPTVIDCTFIGNCVVQGGGAVNNSYSASPTFIRCTFQGNHAGDGGGMYNYQSHPILIDCLFVANYATRYGGGMANVRTSNPTLIRCQFVGNVTGDYVGGGAVSNRLSSNPVMNNCLFTGNSQNGGVISNIGPGNSHVRLNSCILWDNYSPAITGVTGGSADVVYSDIKGTWPGSGNMNVDPHFARTGRWANPSDPNVPGDPKDPNAVWIDGDFHLKSQTGRWEPESRSWVMDDVTSPCIDAGDPDSPVGLEPFPNGGRINMGAYGGTAEASKSYVPHVIYVDASAAGASDGSSWADAYRYLQDALADAATAEKPVEVRVAQGVYRPDQGAGITRGDAGAVFRLSGRMSVRGGYAGLTAADPSAWDPEAYPTVLTGDLGDNDLPITDPYRLHVNPSRDDNSGCVVLVEQADVGMLIEGLTITGAYEWSKASSSPGGAGLSIGPGSDITVRRCSFVANAARGLESRRCNLQIVDCTFRDNISSIEGPGRGGGACFSEGNVHVLRCVFDRNQARQGGGIYGEACLSIEDSVLSRNVALFLEADGGGQGGAIYSRWASCSKLVRCEFYENIAADGGAICIGWHGMGNVPYRVSATMRIEDCTFQGNWAGWGGALYVSREEYQFLRCRFSGNVAGVGGAVANSTAGTHFTHCLFSGNKARTSGACIYGSGMHTVVERRSGDVLMRDFDVTLSNCTLIGNRAPEGSAVACISWGSEDEDSLQVSNCMLDNGAGQIWNRDGCRTTVRFSNGRGGAGSVYDPCQSVSWEQGNLDTDALFVDAGRWDPNGTPDDLSDDFWVDGDYHLKSQGGRWEPESQSWVVDDVTSPCIDAGDPNSPLGLEPFPNGGRINMGAYGGTAEASMSCSPGSLCE